jgi:hypothetical protein
MEVLLRRGILGFFFFLFSTLAWAEIEHAGQVIITSGPLQAINGQNQTRTLERGAYFDSGETLVTGTNSTAQIRFTDGTVIALDVNSQIKVDNYLYQKNPKTDKNFVTLVKGGFRALTGIISKNNPDAYKVETPVAVIGVRGTNYSTMLDKGGLYAGVWKGGIAVKNDKGAIDLGEGQDYNFTVVSSRSTAPVGLLTPPKQLLGQCGIQNAPHSNL